MAPVKEDIAAARDGLLVLQSCRAVKLASAPDPTDSLPTAHCLLLPAYYSLSTLFPDLRRIDIPQSR